MTAKVPAPAGPERRRRTVRKGVWVGVVFTALGVSNVLSLSMLASPSPSSAATDLVINGCTIVDNPTPEHHTDCPGANLVFNSAGQFNSLAYVNVSYANLSGATLSVMRLAGIHLYKANLSHANLSG